MLPARVALAPAHAGKRVEKVLLKALPRLTESFILMLIHRGKVLLDGRALRRGERVPGAGTLEVRPPDPREARGPIATPRLALDVLHEDGDLIAIDKRSGLAMHPGPGHGSNTVLNALLARFPALRALGAARGHGLVQRLDRDVSGVVVVARTARARDALVRAFAAREVEKTYRALTLGAPREDRGEVAAPIDGREAKSTWEVLERRREVALVALHPLTGRKHQLRIHLAGLGCPILGDRRHGPTTLAVAKKLGLRRIALHAVELALRHPVTGEAMRFASPWPAELEDAWEKARR